MNENRNYFIRLLSSYINDDVVPIENVDWNEIYHLGKIHSLSTMVYLSVMKLPEEHRPDKSIYDKMQFSFMNNIKWSIKRDKLLDKLNTSLNKAAIPHIYMKGYVLRHYYPTKEVRSMGDLDIIIKSEDRQKSDELMIELGYEKVSENGEVWNYKKNEAYIEIHTKMVQYHEINGISYEEFFSNPWENTVLVNNKYSYELNKEYHFVYLIAHIAKHFNYCGCGIRMIMDIAVFMNKFSNDLDWTYIWQELEKLKLKHFSENILYLCNKWFNTKLPIEVPVLDDDFYNRIYEYIISRGTFGFYNNEAFFRKVRMQENNNQNKSILKTYVDFVFPSYNEMIERKPYSFIENRRYLLLIGWIYRWIYVLINKPKEIARFLKVLSNGNKEINKQCKIYSDLGI